MTALVLGDFDAESFWRDPELCTLPAIVDPQARPLVAAMDELLFPMCGADDRLVTRGAIDPAQHAYLHDLGFRFRAATADATQPHETIAAAILRADPPWLDAVRADHALHPFAITPGLHALAARGGLAFTAPSLEVVRKVNSKVYSTALRDQLGLAQPGVVVASGAALEAAGGRMLEGGRSLLVKDPFGVSGAGNLVVSSPGMLRRIASHLARQEERGRRTELVVEPLLAKVRDFSCQMQLARDGALTVLSIQEMANDRQAYVGSRAAPRVLVELLAARAYFDVTAAVGRALHDAGYWGPVCLDSMLLADGTVFPIVEINARRSMGGLNHLLDERLADALPPAARGGPLSHLSLSLARPLPPAQLLETLAREDLLHRAGAPGGILPLAAGPLTANAGTAEGRHRARLYVKAIDGRGATAAEHVAHLRRVVVALGGTIA